MNAGAYPPSAPTPPPATATDPDRPGEVTGGEPTLTGEETAWIGVPPLVRPPAEPPPDAEQTVWLGVPPLARSQADPAW